jgi:hypothetical protein
VAPPPSKSCLHRFGGDEAKIKVHAWPEAAGVPQAVESAPRPSKTRIPKIQARAAAPPPLLSPPAADAVEQEVFEDEPIPVKLSRAQLELEYGAVVQEWKLLLNQLAGVLEELMVSVPAD